MTMASARYPYDLTQFPPDMASAFRYGFRAIVRRFMVDSCRSDIEDFAQIAWLAVLNVARKGFVGDSLRRIAANEAIAEWVRVYGNRSKWIGTTTGFDLNAIPEKRIVTEDKPIDEKWLAMLTPTMRELVHAVIVDGMSHKAAAEKLGLTELTVRTTICRAKQRIRRAA